MNGRPALQTVRDPERPEQDRRARQTTFERGVASLAAHKAYIDGLGWESFDPAEFLESGARQAGTRLGVPMAATFEVFSMGWGD